MINVKVSESFIAVFLSDVENKKIYKENVKK